LCFTSRGRVVVGKNLIHEVYAERVWAYDRIAAKMPHNWCFCGQWSIALCPGVDSPEGTTYLNREGLRIWRHDELWRTRTLKDTSRDQDKACYHHNDH